MSGEEEIKECLTETFLESGIADIIISNKKDMEDRGIRNYNIDIVKDIYHLLRFVNDYEFKFQHIPIDVLLYVIDNHPEYFEKFFRGFFYGGEAAEDDRFYDIRHPVSYKEYMKLKTYVYENNYKDMWDYDFSCMFIMNKVISRDLYDNCDEIKNHDNYCECDCISDYKDVCILNEDPELDDYSRLDCLMNVYIQCLTYNDYEGNYAYEYDRELTMYGIHREKVDYKVPKYIREYFEKDDDYINEIKNKLKRFWC